jgi:DNA (cytosine-5)-methyltransferase 1
MKSKFAYYNEIEPYAVEWLRNLMKQGHIADGVVDDRSISDVRPDELQEFTQCHFFAGIGAWSLALRNAGWSDDRPVWTGSCPCQPFSVAGTRKGATDDRHLFPHWLHLIEELRPPTIFGEQVASKDGLGWIDTVQADLEGTGYACGGFDLCSAGFGAPHIRQRLWFVADTDHPRLQGRVQGGSHPRWKDQYRHSGCDGTVSGDGLADTVSEQRDQGLQSVPRGSAERVGSDSKSDLGMGDTDHLGSQGGRETRVGEELGQARTQSTRARTNVGMADTDIINGRTDQEPKQSEGEPRGKSSSDHGINGGMGDTDIHDGRHGDSPVSSEREARLEHGSTSTVSGMADTQSIGARELRVGSEEEGRSSGGRAQSDGDFSTSDHLSTDAVKSFWRDADWLNCRDGKWRAVEPCTFPLANGISNRVGRLRAYGNAITPQVAQGLIESYMEARSHD